MATQETLKDSGQGDSYYIGRTVLELVAERSRGIIADTPQPPPTPPTPFETHTRSGDGMATISDDTDHEHLYE